MVIQQVNLYQPIFRKEQKLFSFRVLIQACGMIALLLVLIYGWGLRQSQQMQADLKQLQNQQVQLSSQLSEVTAQVAGMNPDTTLKQTLERLEQELVARQKVVSAIQRVRDGYTQGVSSYLDSFSRQAPAGVWLTGFIIQAGGEGLVLRGGSLKPSLVPVFLQKLSAEPTLSGTEFGLLQIQREEASSRYVEFTVYTGTETPEFTPLEEKK